MDIGIVCKVWNIKGSAEKKGAIDQLRDSVGYILNEEKTVVKCNLNPLDQLTRECKYVENDLKTFDGAYVGGNNISTCDVPTAVSEMMATKRFFGKESGRAALHMIISLPEAESDASNASKLMQLCDAVVKEVFPNNQAVYAVHANTENLHVHIIVNSVGLDGKKIHQDDKFMRNVLHPCVNKYASIYGFTQNPKWKTLPQKGLDLPQIKMMLRTEIDKAIEKSDSFDEFVNVLQTYGIRVNVGKHISLITDGMNKAMRTEQLGLNYTKDAIVERIATRKDKFAKLTVGQHAMEKDVEEVFTPVLFSLPKYTELSKEQQVKVIHELRLGKNPWRENTKMNWQLNRIADELNASERIRNYVDYYSADKTVEGALNGMIEAKKQLAYEKKLIRYAKHKYKPILDIYDEMKSIEKKAFLYEYNNNKEYRLAHDKYRSLTRRLKRSYDKDVFEIETFLNDCNSRELYAQAQLAEISEEYRELKRYASKRGITVGEDKTGLIDVIDYYSGLDDKKKGIYTADSFFISSAHSDKILQVVKYPAMDEKGNLIEKYEISIFDKTGKEINKIVNDSGNKEFSATLKEIQKTYNFDDCRRFTSFKTAKEFSGDADGVLQVTSPDLKAAADSNEMFESARSSNTFFTFAQAVNHVTDKKPSRVVMSALNPNFIALSTKEDEALKIVIFDKNTKTNEVAKIPLVKDKTNSGFLKLKELSERYGFTDDVVEFNSIDEAKHYYAEHEHKKNVKERVL